MSPFIVTTKPDACPEGVEDCRCVGQSRRAVATLDEARDAARDRVGPLGSFEAVRAAPSWQVDALDTITELLESGGTVGPLPDGTVIEVAPVHSGDLWDSLDADTRAFMRCRRDLNIHKIIDAYNHTQEGKSS